MKRKLKLYLLLLLFIFFFGINYSHAVNISDNTSFDISKEIQYTLTGTTNDPLEEITFTGSYIKSAQYPGYCKYIYPATYLHYHTKSYLNTFSGYSSIIGSDNSGSGWGGSSCNNYVNNSSYYNNGVPKDFFYYDLPYGNSDTVFTYNSDGNLTIQKTHGVNQYSSLAFSSKYFLYNDIYISFGDDTLSYNVINYSDLTTSLLDNRPYPNGFLTPSYIPFPFIDSLGNMKGWLYSCNNNNSICFLSSNGNYFREVIINSDGKLVGPLKFNSNDTKYIFSSNLGNNVIVYNNTLNESGGNIDLAQFKGIEDNNGDTVIYFTGTTLDIVGNYDYTKNRLYLKDFNNFKSSGDDKTYFYDLNCTTPGYTFVSYFADNNKFYCASKEGEYSIQASDGIYYPSTCYNDIITGEFICDNNIKSPNLELAYNNLTGENAGYDPNSGGNNGSGNDTGGNTTTTNTPLNGLGVNGCDYFDVVDINSCNSGEYLIYDNGSLICGSIGNPPTCSNECSPYLYIDFRGCATDILDENNNPENPPPSNTDNSGIINSLFSLFQANPDDVNNLKNSLSGALDTGTNGFSIGEGGTSGIDYIPGDGNYGNIVNRNDDNKTCDMFNGDGSFAYYSNGSYDLSIDLNGILDLGYTDKVPFLEELLFIPNKILSFITNPLQNIFSTLRVFGGIGENTYCYFGTLQTIEFQKHIKIGASFFGGELIFTQGTLTIIDYLILFFIGLPLLILTVRILLY